MSDPLRYRLVDEPRPSVIGRLALHPLLVFVVAQLLLPWGTLLIALNAVALNGPYRNREIGLAVLPIAIYFVALAVLSVLVRRQVLALGYAKYIFAAAAAAALLSAAAAYVTQEESFELRAFLRRGRSA